MDLTSVVKTGKITIPGFVNTLVYVLVKCSTGDTGSGSNTGEMVDGGLQYMCGHSYSPITAVSPLVHGITSL